MFADKAGSLHKSGVPNRCCSVIGSVFTDKHQARLKSLPQANTLQIAAVKSLITGTGQVRSGYMVRKMAQPRQHTHTHIYIYVWVGVGGSVCVCVCVVGYGCGWVCGWWVWVGVGVGMYKVARYLKGDTLKVVWAEFSS